MVRQRPLEPPYEGSNPSSPASAVYARVTCQRKMKTIFLTGKPRSGKSYLINEIVERLQEKGLKVGGILTPDIRENNERTGFNIIDIYTGAKEILASKHRKEGPTLGKYRINVEGINIVTNRFSENLEKFDIIVIDELGVMELKSAMFKEMLDQILKIPKLKLIVLNQHLVKFHVSEGELVEMKRENAEEIKENILRKIATDN